MKSIYASYLQSPTWEQLRRATVRRDRKTCRRCSAKNIMLVVHHLKYPAFLGQETTDHLLTLCEPCHRAVHEENPELSPPTDEKIIETLRVRSPIVFDHTLGLPMAARFAAEPLSQGFWVMVRDSEKGPLITVAEAMRRQIELRGGQPEQFSQAVRALYELATNIKIPALINLFLDEARAAFPGISMQSPAGIPSHILRIAAHVWSSVEAAQILRDRSTELWGDSPPYPLEQLIGQCIDLKVVDLIEETDDYAVCLQDNYDTVAAMRNLLDIEAHRLERTKRSSKPKD